jgi:hypothetical protein
MDGGWLVIKDCLVLATVTTDHPCWNERISELLQSPSIVRVSACLRPARRRNHLSLT